MLAVVMIPLLHLTSLAITQEDDYDEDDLFDTTETELPPGWSFKLLFKLSVFIRNIVTPLLNPFTLFVSINCTKYRR